MHRPAQTTLLHVRESGKPPPSWGATHPEANGIASQALIRRRRGCHAWDAHGNRYIEYGSGGGSVTLGHIPLGPAVAGRGPLTAGDDSETSARHREETAREFLACVGYADEVAFHPDAAGAMEAAIELARHVTGRQLVAASRQEPCGGGDAAEDHDLPDRDYRSNVTASAPSLGGSIPLPFNDVEAADRLLGSRGGELACIVIEAEGDEPPGRGYLATLQRLCDRHGVLLLADERANGFRLRPGGACELHDIRPDLAVFGPSIANGRPIAAVAGRRLIMQQHVRGAAPSDSQRPRVVELAPPFAAALTTMRRSRSDDVCRQLADAGRFLRGRLNDAARSLGLAGHFQVCGHPAKLRYITRDEKCRPSRRFRTLLLREVAKRGLLAPDLVVNRCHGEADLLATVDIISEALQVYRRALREGNGPILN